MSIVIPATHRSRDRLYVLFFLSYIPVIIFFDSLPLWPSGLAPNNLLSLHKWYKNHFNDQLVITQPAWFRLFTLTEPFYQLPVAAWGIWALRSKSLKAPAHLLLWAALTFGTTITCLFEFWHNQLMSEQEKLVLIAMYSSYAVIFGVIGVDMFCRIQKILAAAAGSVEQAKKSR
ncbi:hypothetical protein DXG03_001865 [Asterophora parasitica]|uniref:Efficient mitochondria targeting-associated protein 19 n=1 Tax=Asterophora parasitica TaxID=117018 RepID=A0A9P7G2P2_9AGAR|nr:hypothetical protein DXG03_001865 [Asterophora parasitica]